MKILVIHTSAGAGHTKAAEAVFKGLKKTVSQAAFVDTLDYTSNFYKNVYQSSYTFLVSKAPWLWGIFFRLVDIVWLRGAVKSLRRILNSLNARKLVRFLTEEQFDCIFSTHFFPNEVASFLKEENLIKSKIICIVTDFDVHSIWLADKIDHYAVASDYTKQKLQSFGIVADRITVTGIPTDEKFSKALDTNELKDRLGLKRDIFTVLIATGSFGIGPIEKITESLRGFQVVVVCGRNRFLFSRLTQKNFKHAKIYGLVHNMDELMAVSDCMVTKPGGLSIAEALVRNLPLIFFNAIPGQEMHNIEVLHNYGIGVASNGSIDKIVEEVRKLNDLKGYNASVRERIAVLAKPSAVDDIIKLAV